MSALSVSVSGFVTVTVTVAVWPTETFPKSAGSGMNVSFGQPFLGFANAGEEPNNPIRAIPTMAHGLMRYIVSPDVAV